MKILVVSKISIPAKDRTLPAWEYLRSLGHTVTVEHPGSPAVTERPDALISMGVSIMEETFEALARFPGVPLYAYNWDVYAWIWEPGQEGKVQARHASRPNEYNYVRYGDLLRQAREVWVPSACTGRRTTQWYGITNWRVILSACPWWDYPPVFTECQECAAKPGTPRLCSDCLRRREECSNESVRDDGYALCTLREIPDPWWGKFEQACEELGIPYRCTKHELSYADYQREVAHCRFLVSPLYELSTGGLTLMEGYYLGKPVLLSDSEWHGGLDYFGNRAFYFKHGDVADFQRALLHLNKGLATPSWDQKQYITSNFSDQRMVTDMLRRMEAACTG